MYVKRNFLVLIIRKLDVVTILYVLVAELDVQRNALPLQKETTDSSYNLYITSFNTIIIITWPVRICSIPLGDSGVQHLAAALSTLPSLTVLDLTSNGITHKGLSFIASALTTRDSTSSGTQQV